MKHKVGNNRGVPQIRVRIIVVSKECGEEERNTCSARVPLLKVASRRQQMPPFKTAREIARKKIIENPGLSK